MEKSNKDHILEHNFFGKPSFRVYIYLKVTFRRNPCYQVVETLVTSDYCSIFECPKFESKSPVFILPV